MTSKELFRRLDFFSILEFASQCFESELTDFVYHVSFSHNGLKSERFVLSYSYFFNSSVFDLDSFDFLYFEKFSRAEFKSQVRYFISFYSRCSVRQREILRSSGKLSSLLQYVDK